MLKVGVRVLWLGLIGLFLMGCAANRPPLTCSKKGGPAWLTVESKHFFFRTDLPQDAAQDIANEFETSRSALISAMGAPPDETAPRVEVIVFEREQDFNAVMPKKSASGLFFPTLAADFEHQSVITMFSKLSYRTRVTLLHELTHQILRRRTQRLPMWLDEGLAQFYSTLRIEKEGMAVIGDAPLIVGFWEYEYAMRDSQFTVPRVWLPVSKAPDLNGLLGFDRSTLWDNPQGGRLFYAAAWQFMFTLRGQQTRTHFGRFQAMVKDLLNGTDGRVAFAKAYQGILLSQLEAEYQKGLLELKDIPEAILFEPPKEATWKVTPMSDAEAHATWARLASTNEDDKPSTEDLLEVGLAENAADPALLQIRAYRAAQNGRWQLARQDVATLLKNAPNAPHYLLLDILVDVAKLARLES